MSMLCQNCNTTINPEDVYICNKDLIDRVDSGEQDIMTALEQALYLGVYCVDCSLHFKASEGLA